MEAVIETRKRWEAPTPAVAVLFAVLIVVLYRSSLYFLWSDWQIEDNNYCMLVPFVLAYLVRERCAATAAIPAAPCGAGLLLLVISLALFWLGEVIGDFYLQFLSLWGAVLSLLLWPLGPAKLKSQLFAICFSLTLFPPPALVYEPLTFGIKLLSTRLGVNLLHLVGCSAYREGNVIDLGSGKLQVVDACSGLRYLVPLVILGLLVVYFHRAALSRKILVMLSTVPVALLGNSVRLALTGILYVRFGHRAAEGFLHDFLGWLIFVLSFGLLILEMRLLGGEPRAAGDSAPPQRAAVQAVLPPRPALVAGLLLLALSAAASLTVRFDTLLPPLRPFAQFPLQLAGWSGNRIAMEQRFQDVLALTDYTMVDYRDQSGRGVSLYVAYKGNKAKGGFLHSPGTCLPGSGWDFKESGLRPLPAMAAGADIKINRAFMEKDGRRELVYYWFPKQGRVLTSAWQLKLYGVWDAVTTRRTDAALVRLITPLYPGETEEQAEQRLLGFTRSLWPVLNQFLPGPECAPAASAPRPA